MPWIFVSFPGFPSIMFCPVKQPSDNRFTWCGKTLDGNVSGFFWHAIALCRFEAGELDDYMPNLRMKPEERILDLPAAQMVAAGLDKDLEKTQTFPSSQD